MPSSYVIRRKFDLKNILVRKRLLVQNRYFEPQYWHYFTQMIILLSVAVYLKFFLSDTFTCPILGPLVPLFWISGDVSTARVGSALFAFQREMQHQLRSISAATHCQPLDGQHCGASTGFLFPRILLTLVRLKPAIMIMSSMVSHPCPSLSLPTSTPFHGDEIRE